MSIYEKLKPSKEITELKIDDGAREYFRNYSNKEQYKGSNTLKGFINTAIDAKEKYDDYIDKINKKVNEYNKKVDSFNEKYKDLEITINNAKRDIADKEGKVEEAEKKEQEALTKKNKAIEEAKNAYKPVLNALKYSKLELERAKIKLEEIHKTGRSEKSVKEIKKIKYEHDKLYNSVLNYKKTFEEAVKSFGDYKVKKRAKRESRSNK